VKQDRMDSDRPIPPSEAAPLMYGPDELTAGYYGLESQERNVGIAAILKHARPVGLWYRLLTLYVEGMREPWEPGVEVLSHDENAQGVLTSQLLGLGVSSSKSALDLLLAGYYSIAFAAIRHMVESVFRIREVKLNPERAKYFYDIEPPKSFEVVAEIVKSLKASDPEHESRYENMRLSWKFLSKGAHPSGEGILQTQTSDRARFVFEPTYDWRFMIEGLQHGLSATTMLVLTLGERSGLEAGWHDRLNNLNALVKEWADSEPGLN